MNRFHTASETSPLIDLPFTARPYCAGGGVHADPIYISKTGTESLFPPEQSAEVRVENNVAKQVLGPH